MTKKSQAQVFREVLDSHGIHTLFHFTDRENLESIIRAGGLYSWASCEKRGIQIAKPGGGPLSRQLDSSAGLEDFVRVSFTTQHPMMYVAMNEGRDFVSPEELKNNPYRKVVVREEVRTRRGATVKEVEKVQWIEARMDGNSTHVHKAFDRAKKLLDQWMVEHHDSGGTGCLDRRHLGAFLQKV